MTIVSRTPGVDICDVARVKGAALVVMGWHKPVFNEAVLGGTVQQVMKGSAADVAVFIDRGISFPLRRILLPYTGTVHDRAALTLAARLCRRFAAQVTLLHIVRPDGQGGDHHEGEQLDQGGDRLAVEVACRCVCGRERARAFWARERGRAGRLIGALTCAPRAIGPTRRTPEIPGTGRATSRARDRAGSSAGPPPPTRRRTHCRG